MSSKQLAVFYRKAAGMLVAMLRKERDLTKLRIQELTGGEIKISHLSQFERGEKGFSKPKMKLLLDIFGITPGTFEDRVEALLPEVISGEKIGNRSNYCF